MKRIKMDNSAIIKRVLVFVILPTILVMVVFYLRRNYFYGNNFINKTLLKEDMEFKYFVWSEFDSSKGGSDTGDTYYKKNQYYLTNSGKENFDANTILMLDEARDIIEKTWNVANPLKRIAFNINSAYRTDSRNSEVGGVLNSAHRNKGGAKAKAVDIGWSSYNNEQKEIMEAALRSVGFTRFGKANSFLHVDNDLTLPNPANWTY